MSRTPRMEPLRRRTTVRMCMPSVTSPSCSASSCCSVTSTMSASPRSLVPGVACWACAVAPAQLGGAAAPACARRMSTSCFTRSSDTPLYRKVTATPAAAAPSTSCTTSSPSSSATLVLKVPRVISRRDANSDMDLYDHLVVAGATSLTVLSRRGDTYQSAEVPYARIAAVSTSVALLDGLLVARDVEGAAAAGVAVTFRYNGVSDDLVK